MPSKTVASPLTSRATDVAWLRFGQTQTRRVKIGNAQMTRTATTENPVCDTRAAGVGTRSCAPAKAPVRESPAMFRRPAIVRVTCGATRCEGGRRRPVPWRCTCRPFLLFYPCPNPFFSQAAVKLEAFFGNVSPNGVEAEFASSAQHRPASVEGWLLVAAYGTRGL